MLGAIIGDTVGSVYEFHNIKTTDFPLFSSQCDYTDDSIMTIAVADWLLTDPQHGMDSLEASFLDFAKKYPCPMGGYGGGFHRWLFHPEALGDYGSRDFKPGTRHPYNSFGNGAAMRCSANDYISTKYGYNLNRTCDEIRPVYDWDGSCQGTVPEAMVAFFDSIDFESAIRLAVSLGGDSDTLACITGGIAEAFYKEIPDDIALKIWSLVPEDFKGILRKMEARTSYRLPETLK